MTASPWPPLPLSEWQATRDTLHLWTQIVGKVRLAHEPLANHWWNVPLYLTARGLTTTLIPHPTGVSFQVDFDLVRGQLDVATTTGRVGVSQSAGVSIWPPNFSRATLRAGCVSARGLCACRRSTPLRAAS